MSDDLITIRSFDSVIDAYQLKNLLENEDIPVYVHDEHMSTLNPLYNNILQGVKLKIRATDRQRAEEIIKEADEAILTDEDDKRIACPRCHSTRVLYHLKSSKDAPGVFAMLVSFLTGSYPLHSKDVCLCKDCGHEFTKEESY